MAIELHEIFEEVTTVRPDPQGRISLRKSQAPNSRATAYRTYRGKGGEILLMPIVEIPERELWVHENPEVKASIMRGLEQSTRGEVHDLGSFSQYLKEEDEVSE